MGQHLTISRRCMTGFRMPKAALASGGPHDRTDLSSWDATTRLVTHLHSRHQRKDPDPAGSLDKIDGPHDRTDLVSWEETKRLFTNGSNPNTHTSLDNLVEFHEQHHNMMEQFYDRDDLPDRFSC